MRVLGILGVAALLGLGGCFAPLLDDGDFVCGGATNNYCPPGYFRQGGQCVPKWCQPGFVRGDDGFCHPVFNPCPPDRRLRLWQMLSGERRRPSVPGSTRRR